MGFAGGVLAALGLVYFGIEASLRYQASHGVPVVLYHGRWPTDPAGRQAINDRIQRAQTQEFQTLKRARPIAAVVVVAGVVLIIVASVQG